jgi:DNA-binding transcriptional ArsR family regulator
MIMETQIEPIKILNELTKNFDLKFFKTMSEPVRLEILKFLMANGRSDIGTIAENMPQDRSVISRHLNLLHESGILNAEKETRHIFYEINGQAFIEKLENFTEQVKQCINQCCPSCCK